MGLDIAGTIQPSFLYWGVCARILFMPLVQITLSSFVERFLTLPSTFYQGINQVSDISRLYTPV
jgi:hypothetical protein